MIPVGVWVSPAFDRPGWTMRTHDGWLLQAYAVGRSRAAYDVWDDGGRLRFIGSAPDVPEARADAEIALYECRRRRLAPAVRSPSLPPPPGPWDTGPRWDGGR